MIFMYVARQKASSWRSKHWPMCSLGVGSQMPTSSFLLPLSKFPTFFKLLAWHTLHLKSEGDCSRRSRITVGNEVTKVPCPRACGENLLKVGPVFVGKGRSW